MNIRSKLTKKSVITVLVLIIILVSAVAIFLIKKNEPTQSANQTSGEESDSDAPLKADISGPIPEDKSPASPKLDQELPQGTISVTDAVTNFSNYTGKKIKVRGLVIDAGNGHYDLIDQNTDQNPRSLRLNIGSGINIKPHVNSSSLSSDSVHFADPVTVTGTLEVGQGENQTLALQVEALN